MFKKILNALTTVLLIVLIALVVFVFISRIKNESPSVFGYHIFQVSSGSMEPELMTGDVILDKEVDPSEIQVGDIITYKGMKGDLENKIVTHKVKEVKITSDGRRHFITQGIAKGAIEDPEFDESYVIGKYQRKIPLLNHLYTFFLSDYGLIAFVGLIVILFAYEIISLIFSYKSVNESILDDDSRESNSFDEEFKKEKEDYYYEELINDYKELDDKK